MREKRQAPASLHRGGLIAKVTHDLLVDLSRLATKFFIAAGKAQECARTDVARSRGIGEDPLVYFNGRLQIAFDVFFLDAGLEKHARAGGGLDLHALGGNLKWEFQKKNEDAQDRGASKPPQAVDVCRRGNPSCVVLFQTGKLSACITGNASLAFQELET